MFLSVEMMLQGTALTLVGFGRYHGTWTGQVFTIVILTVAACEASIALALIVILYNQRSSLDVTLWQEIREADVPPLPAERRRRGRGRAGRAGARPRVVPAPGPGRHRAGPSRASPGSSGGMTKQRDSERALSTGLNAESTSRIRAILTVRQL